MKHAVLIFALVPALVLSPLRAGDLIMITDGLEMSGELTLTPSGIRVESPGSTETSLDQILSSSFGDAPFALESFVPGKGSPLPPRWKTVDIGVVATPGTAAFADGTFTLTDGSYTAAPKGRVSDNLLFTGQPWAADGQWTARVTAVHNPGSVTGLMLRDTLDADSAMCSFGSISEGDGLLCFREEAGRHEERKPAPATAPIWLKLTRYGSAAFAAYSSDGLEWNILDEHTFKVSPANPWIGLYIGNVRDRGGNEKGVGGATLDQVSFAPLPSSAQTLPPGVLLQDGTFLAGYFDRLGFDPANPDSTGSFVRNGKTLPIPQSKIATVIMLPTERARMGDMDSHVGVLMKNGDVIDGDFSTINRTDVVVSSILLGIMTYSRSDVRGCFLHPVQAPPANYEVRLKDGSSVNATGISGDAQSAVLSDASGLSISVGADEIAQVRAGSAQVQNLAATDWKATVPPASTPAPAATNAPA